MGYKDYFEFTERNISYDKKTRSTTYNQRTYYDDGNTKIQRLVVTDNREPKSIIEPLVLFRIIIAILLAVNMFTLINSPTRDIITTKELLTTLQSVPDVSIPSIANVTLDNVPNFIESFINSFISMINFSTTVVNMATQTLTFIFWILHDLLGF